MLGVTDKCEVFIVWNRGSKKINTKSHVISPYVRSAIFNEKFRMMTPLDYSPAKDRYKAKKSTLTVHIKPEGKSACAVGEAELDLGHFANNEKFRAELTADKLPLRNCQLDASAHIEISIRVNTDIQEKKEEPQVDDPMKVSVQQLPNLSAVGE